MVEVVTKPASRFGLRKIDASGAESWLGLSMASWLSRCFCRSGGGRYAGGAHHTGKEDLTVTPARCLLGAHAELAKNNWRSSALLFLLCSWVRAAVQEC
jgi:hypothetical protein